MLVLVVGMSGIYCAAQNQGMTRYCYLTENEVTPFGELNHAFFDGDTSEGRVHSNDSLKIAGSPVFLDTISTSRSGFFQASGYNPQFVYPPIFNAPRIYFPTEATEIRELAQQQGLFFSDSTHQTQYRLLLRESQGWIMYSWPIGEPFDPEQADAYYGGVPDNDAIFADGYLELYGTFQGEATIGAHGSYDEDELGKHCIRLLEDVRYWFADPITGAFNDTTGGYEDRLLIISESNITIGNTWENGREDQSQGGDIIITAGLIALGNPDQEHFWGSFSFEDHNEADGGQTPNPVIWEWYTGEYECPIPPITDERGEIHLWGSLAQRRRGYVHRSNHMGTGYARDYHFDNRFKYTTILADIPADHNPVIIPDEVEFGDVILGQSQAMDVELTDEGGTYIDIVESTTSLAVFEVVAGGADISLIPGDVETISIQFSPLALTEYNDTLVINLQYGEDLYVPLHGYGTIVGVEDPELMPGKFSLTAFPNPFNGELRLSWSGLHQTSFITVYDTFGRVVLSTPISCSSGHMSWEPEGVSTGLYFAQLSSGSQKTILKIIYVK